MTNLLNNVPVLFCFMSDDEMTVCEALLALWPSASGKVRTALMAALSALVSLSLPATQTCLNSGLLSSLVANLQQTHLTLTVQTSSTEKLRKASLVICYLSWLFTVLNIFILLIYILLMPSCF